MIKEIQLFTLNHVESDQSDHRGQQCSTGRVHRDSSAHIVTYQDYRGRDLSVCRSHYIGYVSVEVRQDWLELTYNSDATAC